jgi:hypothetical protein
MHAHFHNNFHVRGGSKVIADDTVNTNPGGSALGNETVIVDENNAALVDENGNALNIN